MQNRSHKYSSRYNLLKTYDNISSGLPIVQCSVQILFSIVSIFHFPFLNRYLVSILWTEDPNHLCFLSLLIYKYIRNESLFHPTQVLCIFDVDTLSHSLDNFDNIIGKPISNKTKHPSLMGTWPNSCKNSIIYFFLKTAMYQLMHKMCVVVITDFVL